MPHDDCSEQAQDTSHNKVFSLWSPEELYDLCRRVAKTVCKRLGYPGEVEDITQELVKYLWEKGHTIRHPEHKGAIVNFLKKLGKDALRPRRKDKNLISLNLDGSRELEPSDGAKSASEMLEYIAAVELLTRILKQASASQKEMIKARLAELTQKDIADMLGIKQYQVSRALNALRELIG